MTCVASLLSLSTSTSIPPLIPTLLLKEGAPEPSMTLPFLMMTLHCTMTFTLCHMRRMVWKYAPPHLSILMPFPAMPSVGSHDPKHRVGWHRPRDLSAGTLLEPKTTFRRQGHDK
jgi:hypothetical protein